ncbi:MAG: hybrid sensor histidine kinase/response regulator [Hyphomicrobium sp.]|nr:MAG: hybrid sensor histidine kinase/response regulator [Hyphomicrobium sp.]
MLTAILQTAVGAIITIDEHGIIQIANPACVRMFGYSLEELNGHNVSKLMPAPHGARHDAYVRRHVETGEKRIIGIGRELEGLRKDGSTFWMHLSVSAFTVEGRSYFAGTIIDLDERKRREALMASVFDHIPDGLLITDLDRRVLECNSAFSRIFGYMPTEIHGRSARVLFSEGSGFDRIATAEERLLESAVDSHAPFELELIRKSGEVFPSLTVVAAVRDPIGRAIAMVAIIRDVTHERAQAAALSKAQRLEAYGQLTGGIAHDFNNLLTIISGNQELLELRLKDERDRILLKRAQDAAEMGARLTARLSTFARRRKLEPVVVNLNDLVLGMAELLRRTLGEPIQMSSVLASSLWSTKADPSEIENAILNLAINARDAMPRGGKLIIETRNVSGADLSREVPSDLPAIDYVCVAVADTGSGMSKEVLAHAFEPFFTTKEPGRGTGLGLSTIYGFAKQSGGCATIYSEVGRGTVINIYLPRADRVPSASMPPSSAPETLSARGRTILVVEDNPEVREVTIARLNELGFAVTAAESGPAAVALLEAGTTFDLVFSDVVMAGGMSGFDVAKWIEENKPGLKVLLTSGFVTEFAKRGHLPEASLKVLQKPYGRSELAAALRDVLDG